MVPFQESQAPNAAAGADVPVLTIGTERRWHLPGLATELFAFVAIGIAITLGWISRAL